MRRIGFVLLVLAPLLLSGCVLEQILDDMVNEAPTAVVDAAPREGSAPLDVSFNGAYSHDDDGAIAEYHWNFGDPQRPKSASEPMTAHTFTYPGTYLVKLTVIDDEGAIDSQQIAIVVSNAPPVAEASVSNDAPFPGDRVVFNASGSYDLQGEIISYEWDFGDGITASGVSTDHTFIQGGYYVVKLTVTDSSGDVATTNVGVNVQPGQSSCGDGSCSGGTPAPLAVITGLPSCAGGKTGQPLRFDATASRPGFGKIVSYHWDFGDGNTATGPVVTHSFTRPWTYIITLTVVDEGGGIGEAKGPCPIGGAACE